MKLVSRLKRDTGGATTVEFALLGPVMITMMLGVLQTGIAMWSYNSLRAIASDTARYAVVNYQANSKLQNSQIQNFGRTTAITTPYGLTDANLTITVENAATQRVSSAKELTLSISYSAPTVLGVIGVGNIPMSYSRPIFLIST